MPYQVVVYDNFHYMDPDEVWRGEVFDDAEAAIAHCRGIVDDFLTSCWEPGMTADTLYSRYMMFGEDPAISGTGASAPRFSAWDYARLRCEAIAADVGNAPAG